MPSPRPGSAFLGVRFTQPEVAALRGGSRRERRRLRQELAREMAAELAKRTGSFIRGRAPARGGPGRLPRRSGRLRRGVTTRGRARWRGDKLRIEVRYRNPYSGGEREGTDRFIESASRLYNRGRPAKYRRAIQHAARRAARRAFRRAFPELDVARR